MLKCNACNQDLSPADGHLAIDAEWLRDEWGFSPNGGNEMIIKYKSDDILMLQGDEGWDLWLPDVSRWPVVLTTRHQFTQLATALGIQRKRKDGAA